MAASSNAFVTTVEPLGAHRFTIVWLHDMDENDNDSARFVRSLQLRNIKWICLYSGVGSLTWPNGVGMNITTWHNINMSTDKMQDHLNGLDYAAMRVADILSNEPAGSVIPGVGGVGFGALVALHFATNCALRRFPVVLRLAIGINGWLYTYDSIKSKIESEYGAARSTAYQSILLTHGASNPRVPNFFVNKSVDSLREAGFTDVSLVEFPRLGHEITEDVENAVKAWLQEKLALDPA
ncbi:unnamed protein product [Microthlaspi erraticum]|uniref:Phospholipase/carboxylesterase/thioesterase domain-containing protein n=1 Tax=Microthlaspi erraticum TaxID=1685480 RepID=A0A6D2HE19_9BRAS|nr:unnamed protein product [Microthlaspi erraticum]